MHAIHAEKAESLVDWYVQESGLALLLVPLYHGLYLIDIIRHRCEGHLHDARCQLVQDPLLSWHWT